MRHPAQRLMRRSAKYETIISIERSTLTRCCPPKAAVCSSWFSSSRQEVPRQTKKSSKHSTTQAQANPSIVDAQLVDQEAYGGEKQRRHALCCLVPVCPPPFRPVSAPPPRQHRSYILSVSPAATLGSRTAKITRRCHDPDNTCMRGPHSHVTFLQCRTGIPPLRKRLTNFTPRFDCCLLSRSTTSDPAPRHRR